MLPIGDLEKPEVRRLAEELKLPVFNKPDSQEICFVPNQDYAGLVQRRTPEAFRRQYRRQLSVLIWIGVVLGLGNLGLAALPDQDDARRMVKVVIGVLWLGVAISAGFSRRRLDAAMA